MMYWLPRLDFTGNRPVWSVATFPVGSLVSIVFSTTLLVRAMAVFGCVDAVISVAGDEGALVLRVCWRISFWCPLVVAGDLGRCFRTNSGVNPGNVAKNPLEIASVQVWGTGLHADW